MSLNSGHPFLNEPVPNDSTHPNRRRWARLRVNWQLRFRGEPDRMVETVTHDLSSDGFYCLADTPFLPGEVRRCTLSVPAYHPDDLTRVMPVHCRVRVVRVEALPENGLFGVGCCIEEYHVHSGLKSDR